MPTDPEHNMDMTLKAYADRRRAEAGAPAEMHPATRRLLQGEIARQRPQSPPRAPWWHRLNSFWPRLAAVSTIVIAGFLTFRGVREGDSVEKLNRKESMASTAAAPADDALLAKQAGPQDELDRKTPEPTRRYVAAVAPTPTPTPIPPPANEPVKLADQNEKSREMRVDLSRNKVLMEAVEAKLAERPEVVPLPALKPATTELSSSTRAMAAAAAAPAKSESLVAGNAGQALNWFSKRDAASASSKDKAPAVTTASVLDSFAVEQVGDRLNLIDADGSTYTGALEAYVLVESNTSLGAGKKLQQGGEVQLGFISSAPAEPKQRAGNAYRFRASGTNRTLRQSVTVDGFLEGTIVAVSNLGVNAVNAGVTIQNVGGARQQDAAKQNDVRYFYRVTGQQQNTQAKNAQNRASQANLGANVGQTDAYQQQNWINANRIQGRVQIGGTNSPVQLFDAVPQNK